MKCGSTQPSLLYLLYYFYYHIISSININRYLLHGLKCWVLVKHQKISFFLRLPLHVSLHCPSLQYCPTSKEHNTSYIEDILKEFIWSCNDSNDAIGSNWEQLGAIGNNWEQLGTIGSNWEQLDAIGSH